LAVALLIALLGMPDFGSAIHEYAHHIDRFAQRQRHVTNLVVSVVFDYRGIDTLGEESILFTAIMGTALLLRGSRRVLDQVPTDASGSDAARGYGSAFVPVVLLVGLWTVAFGYVTPGGGFQGGVVLGSAAFLVWVVGSYSVFRRVTPELLIHVAEGAAVTGFVTLGLVSMPDSLPYLANVLPLGTSGQLTSGGTIALLNGFTGLAVAAGVVLLFHEFLQEHIQTLSGVEEESG
jgi:multicomponent Na+:H+ antiporter subunit B